MTHVETRYHGKPLLLIGGVWFAGYQQALSHTFLLNGGPGLQKDEAEDVRSSNFHSNSRHQGKSHNLL